MASQKVSQKVINGLSQSRSVMSPLLLRGGVSFSFVLGKIQSLPPLPLIRFIKVRESKTYTNFPNVIFPLLLATHLKVEQLSKEEFEPCQNCHWHSPP